MLSRSQNYWKYDINKIIQSNVNKPISSPLFKAHKDLQDFCISYLKSKSFRLSNGGNDNNRYGVLIDISWLWEEYVASLVSKYFKHCTLKDKEKYYLFMDENNKRFQRIIPDFILKNFKKVIADAKYMNLEGKQDLLNAQRDSVYYKTVMYMYRWQSKLGIIFYPSNDEQCKIWTIPNENNECNEPPSKLILLPISIRNDKCDFDVPSFNKSLIEVLEPYI